jgi:hypothetical protein
MKTLISALALLCASPAFASLWCASEFQGTPSELAAQALPTLPYQEVQVDLMSSAGQIQIDIQDNYEGSHTAEYFWLSGPAQGAIGGIPLGSYRTRGETSGTVELTANGRVLVTVLGADRAPYRFVCEIPGDYRRSYARQD